jgi:hypothetical protein
MAHETGLCNATSGAATASLYVTRHATEIAFGFEFPLHESAPQQGKDAKWRSGKPVIVDSGSDKAELKSSFCRRNRIHLASQLQNFFPFAKGIIRDIFEALLNGANRASLLNARARVVWL